MPTSWAQSTDVRDILAQFGYTEIESGTITEAIKKAKGWMRAKITSDHQTSIDDLTDAQLDETHPIRVCVAMRAAASAWSIEISDTVEEFPASLERLFADATELRQDIADNPQGAGAGGEAAGEVYSTTMDYTAPVNVDDDINQAIDSDRLSDIASARG